LGIDGLVEHSYEALFFPDPDVQQGNMQ